METKYLVIVLMSIGLMHQQINTVDLITESDVLLEPSKNKLI